MLIDELILSGRYVIEDLLRPGGQAEVAMARDVQTQELVAVKRLSCSPQDKHYAVELARFRRAGTLRFNHPHILDPIECVESDGDCFTVMPYIEGCDLAGLLARAGRLPSGQVVTITRQILDALAAIHARGVVHRDIKPANILVDKAGHVYLIDFGIARIMAEHTLTGGSGLVGSPSWMAPEQSYDARRADPRSDLHNLGAILYLLLSGVSPFAGTSEQQVLHKVRNEVPRLLRAIDPFIPEYLERICKRLLEKDPGKRFQSAAEVLQALDAGEGASPAFQACPYCRCKVQVGAKFCQDCGAGLERPDGIYCLACGGMFGSGSSCQGCGLHSSAFNHDLILQNGPAAGKQFIVPAGTYEVGRDQLSRGNRQLSRLQFRIRCSGDTVHLTNISHNIQTLVNGFPAEGEVLLRDGYGIAAGPIVAVYHMSPPKMGVLL